MSFIPSIVLFIITAILHHYNFLIASTVCLIIIMVYTVYMIIRNHWIYKQYCVWFIRDSYRRSEFDYNKQYDILLFKFWIWDLKKYVDKTVDGSTKK